MTLKEALERSHGHIEQLEPGFRKQVTKWFKECWAKKLYVLVYCSRRTPEEQEELYKKGRVPGHPGPKVTNARGYPECQSMHCYGRAVDFVPLVETATGSFIAGWDDDESYAIAHKIAEATGGLRRLDWETPHLEDDRIGGWRELVSPQKKQVVNEKKKPVSKKNTWASR
jgi:hypothetical protein